MNSFARKISYSQSTTNDSFSIVEDINYLSDMQYEYRLYDRYDRLIQEGNYTNIFFTGYVYTYNILGGKNFKYI